MPNLRAMENLIYTYVFMKYLLRLFACISTLRKIPLFFQLRSTLYHTWHSVALSGFIHSFIHSFIRSFVRSFVLSFVRSFTQSARRTTRSLSTHSHIYPLPPVSTLMQIDRSIHPSIDQSVKYFMKNVIVEDSAFQSLRRISKRTCTSLHTMQAHILSLCHADYSCTCIMQTANMASETISKVKNIKQMTHVILLRPTKTTVIGHHTSSRLTRWPLFGGLLH